MLGTILLSGRDSKIKRQSSFLSQDNTGLPVLVTVTASSYYKERTYAKEGRLLSGLCQKNKRKFGLWLYFYLFPVLAFWHCQPTTHPTYMTTFQHFSLPNVTVYHYLDPFSLSSPTFSLTLRLFLYRLGISCTHMIAVFPSIPFQSASKMTQFVVMLGIETIEQLRSHSTCEQC